LIDACTGDGLVGAFTCTRELVPWLMKNASGPWRGRIVNVASIQGKEGMPLASAYAASKGGLIALTKTLGMDLICANKASLLIRTECLGLIGLSNCFLR